MANTILEELDLLGVFKDRDSASVPPAYTEKEPEDQKMVEIREKMAILCSEMQERLMRMSSSFAETAKNFGDLVESIKETGAQGDKNAEVES